MLLPCKIFEILFISVYNLSTLCSVMYLVAKFCVEIGYIKNYLSFYEVCAMQKCRKVSFAESCAKREIRKFQLHSVQCSRRLEHLLQVFNYKGLADLVLCRHHYVTCDYCCTRQGRMICDEKLKGKTLVIFTRSVHFHFCFVFKIKKCF